MSLTNATCNQCTQQYPCSQCAPTPCIDGCLDFSPTNCVLTSKDIDLNGTIYPKGTTLTTINDVVFDSLRNGVPVNQSQDIKIKVSSADSSNGYLEEKLVGSTNITLTKLNPGNTESLRISAKVSAQTGNALSSLPDGLYVSPSSSATTTVVVPLDTPTIDTIINPVSGGYQISSAVKISTDSGNSLINGLVDGGLYVNVPSIVQRTVSGSITDTITTNAVLTGTNYQIFANAKIDNTGDNILTSSSAGLKVSAAAAGAASFSVVDTNTIDLTKTGTVLSADVKIDPTSTATITSSSAGLKINIPTTPPPAVLIDNTGTVDFTLTGSTLKGNVDYENTVSNTKAFKFNTVSNQLSGEVLLNATTDNKTVMTSTGLYTQDCAFSITNITVTQSGSNAQIDFNISGAAIQSFTSEVTIDGTYKGTFTATTSSSLGTFTIPSVTLVTNSKINIKIKRTCAISYDNFEIRYSPISNFVNVPSGAFLSSWTPSVSFPPKYRIQDGVLYLIGLVSKSLTFPIATAGSFNSDIIDLSLLTGFSTIKSWATGSYSDDYGVRDSIFNSSCLGTGKLYRSGSYLYVEYVHKSETSLTSTRTLGLGGLVI
jgi:hypothetical protein